MQITNKQITRQKNEDLNLILREKTKYHCVNLTYKTVKYNVHLRLNIYIIILYSVV